MNSQRRPACRLPKGDGHYRYEAFSRGGPRSAAPDFTQLSTASGVEKSGTVETRKVKDRWTFSRISSSDGRVAEVPRKVNPSEHDEQVLQALEDAGSPILRRRWRSGGKAR